VRDKRQSDLLDAENRSRDFLGLCAISPFLSLSYSRSLSFFFLASAITRPLPIFARGISFTEKFYFPLFDAIEMQTPVAVSGTASVLPVRSAKRVMHMHTRFFPAIWIYGNIGGGMKEHSDYVPDAAIPRFFFYPWISRMPSRSPSCLYGSLFYISLLLYIEIRIL